jgi:serine/threonine protein kinase
MEYIPGKTLKHLMYEHGRLNEEDALSIIGRILYGLEYLHSGSSGIPIIHRDVKPSNIIIDPDNNPYLVDLGIGKTVTPDARTQILPRAGTYRYAPIEQLQGGSKLSADVHAVSAVIYELLTGKRFPDIDERASNPVAFLRSVETELRNAKVSSAVRTALTGGLQQDPSQRLQNIPSLRKSLTSSKPVQGFTAPIEKSAFDKKIMTEAAQLVLPELVGKKVYVSYHENDRPHAEVLVKLLRQCGVNAVHRYGLEVPQSAATLPAAGTDVIASLMQFTRSLLPAHNSKPTVTGSTPPKRLSLQDVHTAIETSDIVFTLLSPRSLDGITNEQEYIRNIFGQESEAALDQQRLRYQLGRTQFNIVIDPMFLRSYLVDRSGEFFLLQNPQDVIKLRRELRDTLKNLNSRKR